jgi:isopenicillin-N epimerase
LDGNPMNFLVRRFEDEADVVRETLAKFVGTSSANLVLVDNATYAMNIVADSLPLSMGDEVLLTNHEYGAVRRIWNRRCEMAGAQLRTVNLPERIETAGQIVDLIASAITDRTKLLVISHITSPTAITLPVAEITRRVQSEGVAVCIDGPHAVAHLSLAIDQIGCDFYTASCHKWLSAPLGTGFLVAHPRWHEQLHPPILSWGKLDQADGPRAWNDEFLWLGTRDPSAALAIPTAISMLKQLGLDTFRARTHYLAKYARARLVELTGLTPITPDDVAWYGAMAHVPLPDGDARSLQSALWGQFGIEVPIIQFAGRRWIRVSCHLYTQKSDIDRLIEALAVLL